MSDNTKKPTYRVLKTDYPRPSDQGANYFERVCVASKHHALIVRDGSGNMVEVEEISLCDCKDLPVFPKLMAAIKAFELDKH